MSGKAKGKRRAEAQAEPAPKKAVDSDDDEELEFEDEFGDDFEEEEFVQEEDGEEGEEGAAGGSSMSKGDLMDMEAEDGVNVETEGRLWRAGDAIPEGEKLDYDSSAYDMLHRMHMEWPCLTFAFAHDDLGEQRTKFPMTAYAIAGTQADDASHDRIICAKLSQLAKTKHDEDSESDERSSSRSTCGRRRPSSSRRYRLIARFVFYIWATARVCCSATSRQSCRAPTTYPWTSTAPSWTFLRPRRRTRAAPFEETRWITFAVPKRHSTLFLWTSSTNKTSARQRSRRHCSWTLPLLCLRMTAY